jgi:hypothetical protein
LFFIVTICVLQSNLHVTVSALVAAAVVWMSELPARLNPIILPLMASIKREQVFLLPTVVVVGVVVVVDDVVLNGIQF